MSEATRVVRLTQPIEVRLLYIYVALLLLFPAGLSFSALGSLGRPAIIWGTILLIFATFRRSPRQALTPVLLALLGLCGAVLASYCWAMVSAAPESQFVTASAALVRLASLFGVVLTAARLKDMAQVRAVLVFFVITVGCVSVLGLLQILTRSPIIDLLTIPGTSQDTDPAVFARRGFIRASGTAIHPLEYGVVICATLPLAVFLFLSESKPRRWVFAAVAALCFLSAVLSVSRSALIGIVVAVGAALVALPKRGRLVAVAGLVALLSSAAVLNRGLVGTTVSLFSGVDSDPSALSRQGGLIFFTKVFAASPLLGKGFQTFSPSFYIFDNAYVLMAVETGAVGALSLIALFAISSWRSLRLGVRAGGRRSFGYALAIAIFIFALLFAFFDGLSFPQSAGCLFFLIGLASAYEISSRDEYLNRVDVVEAKR